MCTSQSRFLLQLDTHHLNFFLFKVRQFFDICVLPNVKLGIKWGCWATYKFMLVNCKKGFRYKSSIQGIQIVQDLCFTLLLSIKFYVAHDHGNIGNLIWNTCLGAKELWVGSPISGSLYQPKLFWKITFILIEFLLLMLCNMDKSFMRVRSMALFRLWRRGAQRNLMGTDPTLQTFSSQHDWHLQHLRHPPTITHPSPRSNWPLKAVGQHLWLTPYQIRKTFDYYVTPLFRSAHIPKSIVSICIAIDDIDLNSLLNLKVAELNIKVV